MDTRVLVVHHHPLLRYGLAALINATAGLCLVAERSQPRGTVRVLRQLEVDVAVIELTTADGDAWRLIDAIKVRGLAVRVLLMTNQPRGDLVYKALTAGVAGYITAQSSPERIVEAIRHAAEGQVCLSPEAQASLQAFLEDGNTIMAEPEPSAPPRLSEVEYEVLYWIAQGLSNSEVGRVLHLSPSTVKNHRQNLFAKLGVANAPAAVFRAIQSGLLKP